MHRWAKSYNEEHYIGLPTVFVPAFTWDVYAVFKFNLITLQQDATYSVYYISVGSSTCFRC